MDVDMNIPVCKIKCYDICNWSSLKHKVCNLEIYYLSCGLAFNPYANFAYSKTTYSKTKIETILHKLLNEGRTRV